MQVKTLSAGYFLANVNAHQKHTVPCHTVLYRAQVASINALLRSHLLGAQMGI